MLPTALVDMSSLYDLYIDGQTKIVNKFLKGYTYETLLLINRISGIYG